MRRFTVAVPTVVLGVLLFQFVSASISGRGIERRRIDLTTVTNEQSIHASSGATAAVDTFVIAEYTFDDGLGGPDNQGWFPADMSTHDDTLFHIDDFSGLGGAYAPLQGSKSLWCGDRVDPAGCLVNDTYPGYGQNWEQFFESVPFTTTGNVKIDFKVKYDTEPSYDFLYVEYMSKSGQWWILDSFDGQGEEFVSQVVLADSLDGTAQLRFRFVSDEIGSDEDGVFDSEGAVLIDSLTVSDFGGVVDFQDFESEQPGDCQTTDGDWIATRKDPFGDYTFLVDGSTVVQEDPLVTNNTYMWGYFNGSTYINCNGNPSQPVVPYTRDPISNDASDYIHNQVWSPELPINGDALLAQGATLLVDLDVYGDLPADALVYYTVRLRYFVGGCWTAWQDLTAYYSREDKTWQRHFEEFAIEPGATKVQVAVGVQDMCWTWCGVYGSGECHCHGPLIDNVRISSLYEAASGAGDTPGTPSQWALHQNVPNPFNPVTTISYDVPVSGADVSLTVYDVSGRLVRTLVDGRQNAGNKSVTWRGRNDRGQAVATGVYFYRLQTGDFTHTRKMLLIK